MNKTGRQFLALLRAGLWNSPVDTPVFQGEIDWEAILMLARQQTVSGPLFDAINELPGELQPPVDWMRRLYVTVLRIEQSHELLNRRLAEIVPLLQGEGIRSVLLKGQGVARNYANPLRRQCGDIDLYVGKSNYKKACRMMDGWGDVSGDESESHKHAHYHRDGVVVELHRIAERLEYPARDKRFQQWTEKHLLGSELQKMMVDGTAVSLPPVNFDVLYIFNHAYHHFISGGIGLRQLCDWILYLDTFFEVIDLVELEADLKAFGLMRPWKIFGALAVNRLGLVAEKMPLYSSRYHIQADRVLRRILQAGNFGFHDPRHTHRPKEYLKGKWHSFFHAHRQLFTIFPVFPKDVVTHYFYFLYRGVIQVMFDKLLKPRSSK